MQLYAPPGSGKSSLSALLIRYLIIIQKRDVLYIPCTLYPIMNKKEHNAFKFIHSLATCFDMVYEKLIDNPSLDPKVRHKQIFLKLKSLLVTNTVLITDDSQRIYKAMGFWTYVIKNSSCLLLCLTTNQLDIEEPDGSPTELEVKRSLETVQFHGSEFDELLDKMINNTKINIDPSQHGYIHVNPDWFSEQVRDEIYQHTGGYPCLVFRCIERFIFSSNKSDISKDTNWIYDNYFGVNLYCFFELLKEVAGTRCFPSLDRISSYLSKSLKLLSEHSKKTKEVLKKEANFLLLKCLHKLILMDPLTTSMFYSDTSFSRLSYDACLQLLTKICICGKEKNQTLKEDEYFFWSSAFRQIYTEEYLKLSGSSKQITPEVEKYVISDNVEEKALFVQMIVSLFSSRLLKGCMSKSLSENKNKKKKLLEAPYDRFVFLSIRSLGFTSISAQWNQDHDHKGISNFINFFAIFVQYINVMMKEPSTTTSTPIINSA